MLKPSFSIGCITTPKDFAVAGTATDKLYGVAEGLWEPDLVCISTFLSEPFPLLTDRLHGTPGTGGSFRNNLANDLECHG